MKSICICVLLFMPAVTLSQNIAYNKNISVLDNFLQGYADTFHVDNQLFRIVADTSQAPVYCFQLEKFSSGHWAKRFSFGYGIGFHSPDYTRNIDFNGDNYCDLLVFSNFNGGAFIYDTTTAEFINIPLKRPYKWEKIDAAKKLFCSLDLDLQTGDGISILYTFYGLKVYPLYYLQIKNNDKSGKKTCILYKCEDGNTDNKSKIEEKVVFNETYDFYDGFWKARYVKLMGE